MNVILLRFAIPIVALTLLLLTSAVLAEEVSPIDCFQLWNNCQPVNLVIDSSGIM